MLWRSGHDILHIPVSFWRVIIPPSNASRLVGARETCKLPLVSRLVGPDPNGSLLARVDATVAVLGGGRLFL